jgi:uncharacterized membrane protein YecN with MAPEG domain
MANTAKFSLFYKARVIKAIVGASRTLHAFGVTSTGQSPAAPTSATISVTPGVSTLGSIANGSIPFDNLPTVYNVSGAQITNSAASAQLTIPAGRVVHYIGLANSNVLYTYVALSSPNTQYIYEEVGTLTIPSGGYTVRHA